MSERTRNPGFEFNPPADQCTDRTCPFHGSLKLRGKSFTGLVKSAKMQKSVLVEWKGSRFITKYERYKKTKTKVCAHNPSCINAKEGDYVNIMECRPLSKTKNFCVVEVVGKERVFELERELEQEGKHKEIKREKKEKEVKSKSKVEVAE